MSNMYFVRLNTFSGAIERELRGVDPNVIEVPLDGHTGLLLNEEVYARHLMPMAERAGYTIQANNTHYQGMYQVTAEREGRARDEVVMETTHLPNGETIVTPVRRPRVQRPGRPVAETPVAAPAPVVDPSIATIFGHLRSPLRDACRILNMELELSEASRGEIAPRQDGTTLRVHLGWPTMEGMDAPRTHTNFGTSWLQPRPLMNQPVNDGDGSWGEVIELPSGGIDLYLLISPQGRHSSDGIHYVQRYLPHWAEKQARYRAVMRTTREAAFETAKPGFLNAMDMLVSNRMSGLRNQYREHSNNAIQRAEGLAQARRTVGELQRQEALAREQLETKRAQVTANLDALFEHPLVADIDTDHGHPTVTTHALTAEAPDGHERNIGAWKISLGSGRVQVQPLAARQKHPLLEENIFDVSRGLALLADSWGQENWAATLDTYLALLTNIDTTDARAQVLMDMPRA